MQSLSIIMIKGIIFDFNRTLYNPESGALEPGAKEVLEYLSRYKLCLISKKSTEDRESLIRDLGIVDCFLDIQVIEGNKQEAHFQRCLEKMQLVAQEVAVVGDRIREEIKLGNKMGMTTFWYQNGKFAQEVPRGEFENPNYTIIKLDELRNHL